MDKINTVLEIDKIIKYLRHSFFELNLSDPSIKFLLKFYLELLKHGLPL